MGRTGGGVINVVMKSGTNQLHGSAFYYNRNEYFAANTPLTPAGTKVRRIRNGQGGFSAGGPILKNRTFFFIAGEYQKADASNAAGISTLSPAWISQGASILSAFGIPQNPVTANLVSFFPSRIRTGPAVINNYFSVDPNTYDSYNGILNNLVLGANYFLQTFNDYDTSPDPIAAGLNTGVTAASLRGSPTIRISGFASAGVNQPLGRIDTTGHVTDTVSMNLGRHKLKLGGEYRRAVLDIFYESGTRGTFTFDGTRGPWASSAAYSAQQRALADFLAGYPTNSSGATIVRPAPGVKVTGSFLQRDYTQNSADFFVHDTWQLTPRLTVNFGLRYEYLGPLADQKNLLTVFVPGKGIVGPGNGLDTLYHRDLKDFAPRLGFAWQPSGNGKTVIRAAWGVYYDVPAVAYFAANN